MLLMLKLKQKLKGEGGKITKGMVIEILKYLHWVCYLKFINQFDL